MTTLPARVTEAPPEIETSKHLPMRQQGGVSLASFEDAWRFSKAVILSGMAPPAFKKPEQVLIAIQHGAEIGLLPMQALQSIAVINSRPTLWGDALPGLVWASGVCAEVEEFVEGEGEQMVAVCRSRRVGQERMHETRFGVADAKKAALWGKDLYQKYPKRMLQMRARAFNFRDNFADVLKGLQVREEVEDYQVIDATAERQPLNLADLSDADEEPPQDTQQGEAGAGHPNPQQAGAAPSAAHAERPSPGEPVGDSGGTDSAPGADGIQRLVSHRTNELEELGLPRHVASDLAVACTMQDSPEDIDAAVDALFGDEPTREPSETPAAAPAPSQPPPQTLSERLQERLEAVTSNKAALDARKAVEDAKSQLTPVEYRTLADSAAVLVRQFAPGKKAPKPPKGAMF